MNNELHRYRRAVKSQLCCTGKSRRILLLRLRNMLDSYQAEHPAPTAEDLRAAFGPPEEMAALLSEFLTEKDRLCYRRKKQFLYATAGVLTTALLLFSLYVFFVKDLEVTTIDTIYIYPEELISTPSSPS